MKCILGPGLDYSAIDDDGGHQGGALCESPSPFSVFIHQGVHPFTLIFTPFTRRKGLKCNLLSAM
jgi:hypothetical protein